MRPRQHIRLLAWLITAVLLSNSGCTLLRRRREERIWQPPPPPHPWPEAAIAPEWPGRGDVADPTVDFFRVLGWSLESREVEASVFRRDADGRGRGTFTGLISLKEIQAGAGVILRPPAPLTLGEPFDTVELWVRALSPDQETPPQGRVEVMVQTRDGTEHRIRLGELSGEWSLLRLRVDDRLAALTTHPCRFLSLRISDLPASDQFFLYLDNLAFYTEVAHPLRLPPRPHLDLPHAPYRSRVLHRGEQRLPFPTRAETVRPDPTARGTTRPSISQRADQAYVLAPDAGMRRARYVFRPRHPERLLELEWDGLPVAVLLTSDRFRGLTGEDWAPAFIHLEEDRLTTEFLGGLRMEFSLSAASLILDLQSRRPVVEALDIGTLSSAHPLATRYLPGWSDPEHGGPLVAEIRSGGEPFFLSAIADPYRTQAAALSVVDQPARIHPVLLYHPKTDGRRRPLHERVIWTASSQLGEVLPVVPHPPSIYRSTLGRHLWDDSTDDRPDDPSNVLMARRVTAVDDISGGLFQQNPVLANSADLLHIDPSRPGWSDAFVQREPDGNWRQLSAREYALKAPTAVEAFAQDGRTPLEQPPGRLAVTPAAFTGTRPWRLTDYDARNDDAASWRSVFLCYGELLDLLRAYRQRPVVALGASAPLYAGLADGVVLEADPGRWPHQPLFHARRLAPLAVFYGAGAFEAFISDPRFTGLQPHEQADRYLAQQMAYGLAGRLIPHAVDEALHRRSYLLMASLQPLLLEAPPVRLRWHDGTDWHRVEAVTPEILVRSHLRLEFRNQLTLFVNGSAAEHWPLAWQGHRYFLPPFGWAAFAPDFIQLGAEREGGRFDYVATPSLRYFDGRGDPEPFRGFASADPVLLRRIGSGSWEAIVFGSGGDVTIPPPDLLPADAWDVEARDRTDQPLERWSLPVTGDALRLPGHEGVWRYVLTPQAPAQPDHP